MSDVTRQAMRLTMTAAIHARFAHRVDGLVHSHPWSIEATVEGPADAAKVMPADDLEAILHRAVEPLAGPVPDRRGPRSVEGLPPARVGRRADRRGDRPPAVGPARRGGARAWCRWRSSSRPSSTARGRCDCPSSASAPSTVARVVGRRRHRRRRATGLRRDAAFFVVAEHGLDLDPIFDAPPAPFFALPAGGRGAVGDGRRQRLRRRSARRGPAPRRCSTSACTGFDAVAGARRVPRRRRGVLGGGARRRRRRCCATIAAGARARRRTSSPRGCGTRSASCGCCATRPATGGRRCRRPASTPTTARSRCSPPTASPGLEVRPRGRAGWVPRRRAARQLRRQPRRHARPLDERPLRVDAAPRRRDGCRRAPVHPVLRQPRPGDRGGVHPVVRDDEHPCRYEPITAGDFLRGRIDGTIPLDDVRSS